MLRFEPGKDFYITKVSHDDYIVKWLYLSHSEPLFKKLNDLEIDSMFTHHLLNFCYDLIKIYPHILIICLLYHVYYNQ